jgi:hypothetical protein
MTDMRALDQKMRTSRPLPEAPVAPVLTSEERNRVLKLRRVSPSDVATYSSFLSQERTGIFKLFPDIGCTSSTVVRLAQECEQSVPLSSSFTFRTVGYGDEIYHDIFFKVDRIISNAFFSQGIFTIVGDEPIENIALAHPSLRFLNSFRPDTDPQSASEHAEQLREGILSDGYRYTDTISPKENVTYVIRLIAYRLENALKPLSPDSTRNEMLFLSLSVDKRIDVTVAFRVLGRDEYGGLTIVWKELERREAPKIKFAKTQPLRDFKPEQN